jgi:chromosome segregation ATPase
MSDMQEYEHQEESVDDFPPYANDENKRLNGEIKEKRGFITRFHEEIEQLEDRVKILTEHLKNIQQELLHTQTLVDGKTKEIQTEDHMKQLAERQTGRLYAELQKIEQQAADQQDRLNTIQNQIFKGNEKLDQYKLEMNWNQEELEQWALASRQKEEDYLTLMKYQRADEAKIKELTLHIEKLTMEVRKTQDMLDKEVTETQAAQIELNKTAEEFKKMHEERHSMYNQLQETVKACKRLDENISHAGDKFAEDKIRLKKKQKKLVKRKEFLQTLQSDNQKTESEITLINRQLADKRLEEINMRKVLDNAADEVEIRKNQLSAAASELTQKRIKIITENADLAKQNARWEAGKKKASQTRSKLTSEYSKTDTLEESANTADKLLKNSEAELDDVEKKIRDKKEKLFRKTQKLFKLRAEEASLLGEISGALAAGRNLQANLNSKEQEVQRQYVLLYNADYSIQYMERRVDQAKGVQVTEQNKELKAKIKQKEQELVDRQQQLEKVTKAVKQLQDDLRLLERKLEKTKFEEDTLKTNLDELNLQIKMIEKDIDKEVQNKDKVLVQHDTMKLEVKKLKDTLCAEADKLFSEENRNYQLKMSMEEREKEIKVHKEVLQAENKAAEDEKHKVKMELAERESMVENLKVKFENLCYKNVAKEDGEERTQAYYVIKAAQEREELQRYGDELDAKIKKAEREIRSLTNTLDHLKNRNKTFRDSFVTKGEESEIQTRTVLEDQCKSASEQLFRRRKELQDLQAQYENEMRHYMEGQTRFDTMKKVITDRRSQMEQSDSLIKKRTDQLQRAIRSAKSKQVSLEFIQELDTEVQLERLKNMCLLAAFNVLIDEIPEVAPLIDGPLAERGLKALSRPPSVASSVASSR